MSKFLFYRLHEVGFALQLASLRKLMCLAEGLAVQLDLFMKLFDANIVNRFCDYHRYIPPTWLTKTQHGLYVTEESVCIRMVSLVDDKYVSDLE
jgi:hypothetical protein